MKSRNLRIRVDLRTVSNSSRSLLDLIEEIRLGLAEQPQKLPSPDSSRDSPNTTDLDRVGSVDRRICSSDIPHSCMFC
jgi:hypothetical protein